MRKQFKKALSMVLSAAMVLTLGSGMELKSAKAADAKTCDVTFNDAKTESARKLGTINGNGTYTLKYEGEFTAVGPTAMYLQFGSDEGEGVEDATSPAIKDVTIKADGEVVEFAKAPAISKDGKKVQVQFYNAWGGSPWDGSNPTTILEGGLSALDFTTSLEVTFTIEGFWEAPAETEAPATSGSSVTSGSGTTPAPTASGSSVTSGSGTPTPPPAQTGTPEPTPLPPEPAPLTIDLLGDSIRNMRIVYPLRYILIKSLHYKICVTFLNKFKFQSVLIGKIKKNIK